MSSPDLVTALLFGTAIIVLVARLFGLMTGRLGQPVVIGEILAGLLLGPSGLEQLPGNLPEVLLPEQIQPGLGFLGQVALILFMFATGLDVDHQLLRGSGRAATAVSLSSVAVPLALGSAVGLWLYGRHGSGSERTVFALFIGAALAVSAFPVLARIMTQNNLIHTPLGVLTLAAAAIDDVLAWTLLALILPLSGAHPGQTLTQLLVPIVIFVGAMFGVARPGLRLLASRFHWQGLTPASLAVCLAGLFLSAAGTNAIGIHAIFGAFLFGAIFPRHRNIHHQLRQRVEPFALALLPVFFYTAALNANIGQIGVDGGADLLAILAAAGGGKVLAGFLAARITGSKPRAAATIGVLLNTRGLTEVVILTAGLDAGIIHQRLYTILILMALITTATTQPLLTLIQKRTNSSDTQDGT